MRRRLRAAALIALLGAVQPAMCLARVPSRPGAGAAWLTALRAAGPARRMDVAYDLQALVKTPSEVHASVAALAAATSDSDSDVRSYVADALGEIAADPQVAVPALVRMLGDSEPDAGLHAALALHKFGSDAVTGARALLEERSAALPRTLRAAPDGIGCLFDDAASNAVFVLQQAGDDGTSALAHFLDGAHLNVLDYAVFGLSNANSPKAIEALGAALRTADAVTMPHVAEGLESNDPLIAVMVLAGSPDSSFEAASLLASTDSSLFAKPGFGLDSALAPVRYGASIVAAKDRTTALPPTQLLIAAMRDPDPRIRRNVVAAIARSAKKPEAVRALKAASDDADPDVRTAAAASLKSMARVETTVRRAAAVRPLSRTPQPEPQPTAMTTATAAPVEVQVDPEASLRTALDGGDVEARRAAIEEIYDSARLALLMRSRLENIARGDPDTRARYEAAQTLVVHHLASPAATAAIAEELVATNDPAAGVFFLQHALDALGPEALPMLRTALRAPAGRNTNNVLTAIAKLGPAAGAAVPELKRVAATNDDADLRMQAIEALIAVAGDAASLGSAYTAYVVEKVVVPRLAVYRREASAYALAERDVPCRAPRRSGARRNVEPAYPRFPWPPPPFSSVHPIPQAYIGDASSTLDAVATRLLTAVQRAGYEHVDSPFRAIPDGFVLVTPLEQADSGWHPLPQASRWRTDVVPAKNLAEVVADLFTNPPGHFRMIVIAVTSDSYVREGAPITSGQIQSLAQGGASGLPDALGRERLGNRKCFALVYQFEKKLGVTKFDVDPAPPGAEAHLNLTGIMPSLRAPR